MGTPFASSPASACWWSSSAAQGRFLWTITKNSYALPSDRIRPQHARGGGMSGTVSALRLALRQTAEGGNVSGPPHGHASTLSRTLIAASCMSDHATVKGGVNAQQMSSHRLPSELETRRMPRWLWTLSMAICWLITTLRSLMPWVFYHASMGPIQFDKTITLNRARRAPRKLNR